MFRGRTKETGTGIIEAIIVISIISVSFAALMGAAVFYFRTGLYAADQVQALFLLDESAEAVRFMRDESYLLNITPLIGAGPMYLEVDASGWTAVSSSTPINGMYKRTVELSEVYRRVADDTIVPASSADLKTLDMGTVQLTTTVSWKSESISAVTYISDLYEN